MKKPFALVGAVVLATGVAGPASAAVEEPATVEVMWLLPSAEGKDTWWPQTLATEITCGESAYQIDTYRAGTPEEIALLEQITSDGVLENADEDRALYMRHRMVYQEPCPTPTPTPTPTVSEPPVTPTPEPSVTPTPEPSTPPAPTPTATPVVLVPLPPANAAAPAAAAAPAVQRLASTGPMEVAIGFLAAIAAIAAGAAMVVAKRRRA